MNKALQKAIFRCKSVISLPAIYQKISVKIDHPSTTNNELAEIVKLDPGVSSKLLAIVNSAFYGFPSQISTISHAISIVGLSDFKNLVLSSSVVQLFDQSKSSDFSLREFWDHSLMCAISAKMIGKHWSSRQDQETLFIAGLLHDVGKLVILQSCKEQLQQVIAVWPEQNLDKERQLIGFDHSEAGAELIKSWGLPELLSETTRQHHQLDLTETPKSCVLCVYMANLLALGDEEAITTALELCNSYSDTPLTLEQLLEIRDQAQSEKNTLIGVYLN